LHVKADPTLDDDLEWAIDRMKQKGFPISSPVTLTVDPKLTIMGYAKQEEGSHRIVVSEWALDSTMLGGLLLHELAHIYFTEQGAHSHDGELLEEVLGGLKERDGLRAKETEYLVDAFNHLQNVLVDDIVFDVMDDKERETAKRFFVEWVSDRPSGDPVLDAALLARNAFAVASLKRRGLYDDAEEMHYRNKSFLAFLGQGAEAEFEWLEGFFVGARSDWNRKQLSAGLVEYFERMVAMMRTSARLGDLR
jgi:hypothetical protein